MRSRKSFIQVMKKWKVEALKHRQVQTKFVIWGPGTIPPLELDHQTLVRVFNHDITSKTKDQYVKKVNGGTFSYYTGFGRSKGGAFVNIAGFPLDLKHFMANVDLGNTIGETAERKISVDEEYWQGIDPNAKPGAITSSFSPEDLLSNALGLIYSRYDDDGNFIGDLEGFLKEAETLFSTNALKDDKYIKESDVSSLRSMIKKYHDTDDFRDFKKGGKAFENMKKNREKRKKEVGAAYKFYLKNVYNETKSIAK